MTTHHVADEPELVPPAELLRLRAELRRGPSASTRAKHLAAAVEVSRQHSGGAAGRFASRGVRAAVAVVASLVITSGLAAAQVLPPPAQRFLSSVSDRFSPPTTARPASVGDPGRSGAATTADGAEGSTGDSGSSGDDGVVTTPTSEGASTTRPGATATTQPRTDDTTLPTVTVPGPLGPGSPDDPTDPGTDGGPTDPGTDSTDGPTDPGTTTTTTTVGGTDGGTDGAGSADVTTTTAPGGGGSD